MTFTKELQRKQRIPKLKGLIYDATIKRFNPKLIDNYKNQLNKLLEEVKQEKKVINL
jgi:hypothetical protein